MFGCQSHTNRNKENNSVMLYNSRCVGVKNTNLCQSHQKGNYLPSLCMMNHTLYTSLFMFYTTVGEWKSWKSSFLQTERRTLTTLHFSRYLLESTSTNANRTVMCFYTLPNQTYNNGSLDENCRFHSASRKMNFQNQIHLRFV
jgi:hypothetical protein